MIYPRKERLLTLRASDACEELSKQEQPGKDYTSMCLMAHLGRQLPTLLGSLFAVYGALWIASCSDLVINVVASVQVGLRGCRCRCGSVPWRYPPAVTQYCVYLRMIQEIATARRSATLLLAAVIYIVACPPRGYVCECPAWRLLW
jgi:hypothetical protein